MGNTSFLGHFSSNFDQKKIIKTSKSTFSSTSLLTASPHKVLNNALPTEKNAKNTFTSVCSVQHTVPWKMKSPQMNPSLQPESYMLRVINTDTARVLMQYRLLLQ